LEYLYSSLFTWSQSTLRILARGIILYNSVKKGKIYTIMDFIKKKSRFGFKKSFLSEYYIVPIILAICVIGIITAGSAIQTRTYKDSVLFADEFIKQIFSGFLLGLFLAYSIYIIGIENILKFKRVMLAASLITLLYLAIPSIISLFTKADLVTSVGYFNGLPIKPVIRNAAVRWLSIGPLQFQPVELVKITVLLYMAHYFRNLNNEIMDWDYIKRPLYIFALTCFFILIQPDLGSVVIITLMLATILFLLRINIKQSLIILLILAIFSMLAIAVTPYRRERIMGWLSNSKIQQVDAEYLQIKRVQDAVAKGGLTGVGYTNGVIKNSIPEVSSDAILAVLAEEFGFFAILFLILLYSLLFFYCIQKSFEIQDTSRKIILIGIGSWIFYQSMWNIAGVVGLVPLKGLPLPFISEGGTSVAVSLLGVGLILACIKRESIGGQRKYVKNNN
jgi:cell division protein FtsW (lipid II flippase)